MEERFKSQNCSNSIRLKYKINYVQRKIKHLIWYYPAFTFVFVFNYFKLLFRICVSCFCRIFYELFCTRSYALHKLFLIGFTSKFYQALHYALLTLFPELNEPLKKGIEEIKARALVIGQTQVACGMKQVAQDYVDQVRYRQFYFYS